MKAYSTLFLSQFALGMLLQTLSATFGYAQQPIPYPDSSFNNSGRIELSNFTKFTPQEQAIQADGKILCGGYGENNAAEDSDGIIYRIDTDGTLDETFGTGGHLRIDIDGAHDAIEGIAVLPDQKILILLESTFRTIFVRLLPDGSYDPDFGNEGILLPAVTTGEYCYEMRVKPDQKIVVVGFKNFTSGPTRGYVRQFNPDGSPDSSFGTNGYLSVIIEPTEALELYDCAIQPDGKILVTGPYGSGSSSGFPVIRLNSDGSFDNTFSGDGIYLKELGISTVSAKAYCISLRPDDNMIFVGGEAPLSNGLVTMTISAIKSNGAPNATFGAFGTVRVVLGLFSSINDITVQPDGKLLLGGYCFLTDTATAFAYARLNSNGVPDNTFGLQQGAYLATLSGGGNVQAITDMDLLPDGRLVSTGWMAPTINLTANLTTKCTVFRSLLDIVVGTAQPNPFIETTRVFPNPAGPGPVVLEYSLREPKTISIALFDLNGTRVADLVDPAYRPAGQNREQFQLPATLPAGTYFVLISGDDGIRAIKLVKE